MKNSKILLFGVAIWKSQRFLRYFQLFILLSLLMANATFAANPEGKNPELKLAYYKHSFSLGEHYNSLRDA